MDNQQAFVYWINERERMRTRKEAGNEPPYSSNPFMADTYFCNVHREDDRVTKWIRSELSQYSRMSAFPAIMGLARLINWPTTLRIFLNEEIIPYWSAGSALRIMDGLKESGQKIFGGAYVVTTHGVPMSKNEYVVGVVDEMWTHFISGQRVMPHTCEEWHKYLMQFEGFASFMAAQIVADLKNTEGHILERAPDWLTFVAPGPGSKKGLNYFFGRDPGKHIPTAQFKEEIEEVREYMEGRLDPGIKTICNQDLQNCLCEYSKFMRVMAGGRSKRRYPQ